VTYDVTCEQVVELLLDSRSVQCLIDGEPLVDNLDNERTTCLHLAARNGHVDIIKYFYVYIIFYYLRQVRGVAYWHQKADERLCNPPTR